MKFFSIILSICCYLISQTMIDARTTELKKTYWSLPNLNDYQGDYHRYKSNRRRQAGWGKRHALLTDEDFDELPLYHPYASQDNAAHIWFDDA